MVEEHITRKLAAIFYADVAGYSRLTGADEEGTHRTLRAYLDAITTLIERHGGRVLGDDGAWNMLSRARTTGSLRYTRASLALMRLEKMANV